MSIYVEVRGQPRNSIYLLLLLRYRLSLAWSLSYRLGWLARELQGATVSTSPTLELNKCVPHLTRPLAAFRDTPGLSSRTDGAFPSFPSARLFILRLVI